MLAYSPLTESSASHSPKRCCRAPSMPPRPPTSRRRKDAALTLDGRGAHGLRRRGGLGLAHQPPGFVAADALEVVAVLEQHAEGVVDRLRVEHHAVERCDAVGPV